jgi:hypothetical protein
VADVETFRMVFPEFEGKVSDEQILYWFGAAGFDQPGGDPSALVAVCGPAAYGAANRLGKNLDLAVMLFAAHNLALGEVNARAASRGKTFGAAPAPMTSKGAAGLSASYDTALTSTSGAGIYNATSYGQRLWKLLESAAMGGFYVAPPPRRNVFGYGRWRR